MFSLGNLFSVLILALVFTSFVDAKSSDATLRQSLERLKVAASTGTKSLESLELKLAESTWRQSLLSDTYDEGLFTPVESLSTLTNTYTTLGHPAFPHYSVRIKKSDFCDETVGAYTGYIDIEARHIFFYFFESRSDPDKDDVVFWTNGGPGCSSSLVLFMELGPCRITTPDGPVHHNFSWNEKSNLFFVDQPIGIGFSYADYGEYVGTTEEAAKDIAAFVSIFFENISQFKGRAFHMAGESYGGRYLPVFASEVYDQNAKLVKAGMTPINLTSVMIGNGLTDFYTMIPSYFDIQCSPASVAPHRSCFTAPDLCNDIMPRNNQYKALPPQDEMEPIIRYYWSLGLNDTDIAYQTLDHFDQAIYGLSGASIKRLRKKFKLLSTRQQQQTFATIAPFVQEIRSRFPAMGARQMVVTLRQDYHIKVAEKMVAGYLKLSEPDAVRFRQSRRFKRKPFYSAGIMDILAFDQHDKWGYKFGLWLHHGLDPFIGRIAWMKIWWCNRNNHLITSYYLEACRKLGGIPLVTQSDPGKENNGIANCHTEARHRSDPSLVGSIQHRWKREKTNVKPEAEWSQLRRQFTPGFETILDEGVNSGLYDPSDHLEYLVFRWLAIPWLQAELDAWTKRKNSSPRRANKNKVLPQGIPDMMAAKPHLYHTRDFKVIVSPELFDELEERWAPKDDPVFDLVPPAFEFQAQRLYTAMGRTPVASNNFWAVYSALLASFHDLMVHDHNHELAAIIARPQDATEDEVPLLPGLKPLRHGDSTLGDLGYVYLGGLEHPPKFEQAKEGGSEDSDEEKDLRDYADFSS